MINILRELCQKKIGRIEGVSMADMLQLIWLEKMTCQLQVKSSGKLGTLNILDGELKNATTKSKSGQEAAMEIMTWKNTKIELDNNSAPVNQTLIVSTEEILLENIRHRVDKNIEWEKKIKKNVSNLNKSIDTLKEDLGGSLLATEIWSSSEMKSIAGWSTEPATATLIGQITQSTNHALQAGFPSLIRYCLFDLLDGKLAVLIPMGGYAWGILLDKEKIKMGILLNVALPKVIAAFEDAITSN